MYCVRSLVMSYTAPEVALAVYDITNPQSFENLMNWKQVFLTKSNPTDPQTLPFLVLANKVDLEEGYRKVPTVEGKKFCQ